MHTVLVLLSLLQGLWLDVPWVQQEKNGCGSASVWMVLQYWKHQAAPLHEIHRNLFSETAGGVFASDMEKYFHSRGYRTFAFRGEWADLEQHLSKGRPLIVCLERNARGVPLHYVVVAGLNSAEGVVLVNDPAQRKLRAIERAEFETEWKATDNWTLLALPDLELAGSAFREERYSEAKAYLKSALRFGSSDAYTNEFLATVYFLENNLESALKYWNRIGKPIVDEIRFDPPLRTRPAVVDRALAFARGSVMTLAGYRETRAHLDAAGMFSQYQFDLSPADPPDGGRFDVTIRAAERDGPQFLSWLRGLPYHTVHPAFFNIGGRAIHVKSLVRWDANRRRAFISVSAPVAGDPKWTYRVDVDGRDERWDSGPSTLLPHRLRKTEIAAHIRSVPNGSWSWTSGVAFSQRSGGASLKYMASADRSLLYIPEKRFTLNSAASVEIGKQIAPATRFAKIVTSAAARWLPRARGDDFETTVRFHVGRALGAPPWDELFVLGLDRDPAFPLRAHSAIERGRKSASALARSFALFNGDVQKILAETTFIRLQAGPFFDAARPSASSKWLLDSGLLFRVSILNSFTFTLSYGKDLRTGHSVLFTNTLS